MTSPSAFGVISGGFGHAGGGFGEETHMVTRADVVNMALSQNGYHNGQGYDERCKYSQFFLGPNYGAYGEGGTGPNDTPVEAYCFIFASWVFEQIGLPLPQMGAQAISSGGQYVPQGYLYATQHGAAIPSYLASPGDLVMFQWDGLQRFSYDWSAEDGKSHVEIVERWANGVLYTIGGNSGASNVDGFVGTGGVHRHAWSCPAGIGNDLIVNAINTSKLVTFGTTPEPPVTVVPMPSLPVIDPGRDVGHPKMVTLIDTLMKLDNPKVDLSTPAKRTQAVKQWQMVMFNGWQTPPHGPRPQAVTGKVDAATLAAILHAAGV